MVTPSHTVADVGCDHAYVSIYLIENEIAPKVIAMDVNEGPLSIAKNNISMKGYEDKIETRLSNGLEKLSSNEVDSIIIAGMGGSLTCKILQNSASKVHSVKELVLQPQSEVDLVRKLLERLGFSIVKEEMLIDDGKYYVVIRAVNDGGRDNGSEVDCNKISDNGENEDGSAVKESHYLYGKYLLDQQNPILHKYLLNQKEVKENIKHKLEHTDTDNANNRLKEINKQLKYIDVALEYY